LQFKLKVKDLGWQRLDSHPLKWFLLALITLIVFDVIALTNIPVIKQVVVNSYLLLAPGLLILIIFKLDRISFIKKSILTVGFSISTLIFAGLLINSFYPVIKKPLSFAPLLVTFNLIILILTSLAFQINREGFILKNIFNFTLDLENKLKSPLLFPLLFPLLAVLGTSIMNNWGNNLILLLMLLLIPSYFVMVIHLQDEMLPKSTYPLAIWMISLGLLLMHGLTSHHLMGNDIHNEFYSFQVTLNSFHWSVSNYYSSSNSVISVTILPMFFHVLSQINAEYVFKLIFVFIGSFTPLAVYLLTKKYLNRKYAFVGSLFFIFQVAFIYNLLSSTKTLIAIFIFALAVLLVFEDEIAEFRKKIMFIILLIVTVLAHYTTSYIMVILFFAVFMVLFLSKYKTKEQYVFSGKFDTLKTKRKSGFIRLILPRWKLVKDKLQGGVVRLKLSQNFTLYRDEVFGRLKTGKNRQNHISANFFTIGFVVMFIAIIFVWYSQLTSSPASNTVEFITNTIQNVGNIFVQDLRSPTQNSVLGLGVSKLPQLINTLIYDSIFGFIGIGILFLVWKRNYRKLNIDSEFVVLIITSTFILFAFLIFPYLSKGYGGTRLFTQLAVFLALPFVLGVVAVSRVIGKLKWDLMLLSVMLVLLLACVTYIPYQLLGDPVSPNFDENGLIRGQTYIDDMDMLTAEWLDFYRENLKIYSDRTGSYVLALAFKEDPYLVSEGLFFNENKTISKGYLFLRKANTKGFVYINDTRVNINSYENLFTNLTKIYDNGEGAIYFTNNTLPYKRGII
jgi:uncharacterized membrane protein